MTIYETADEASRAALDKLCPGDHLGELSVMERIGVVHHVTDVAKAQTYPGPGPDIETLRLDIDRGLAHQA